MMENRQTVKSGNFCFRKRSNLLLLVPVVLWLLGNGIAAVELGKKEWLEKAQEILREASHLVPTIPDKYFSPHGPAFVQKKKVELLREIANIQREANDRAGLHQTAERAIHLAGRKGFLAYPLILIGHAQVKAGDLAGGAQTAETALEAALTFQKVRSLDVNISNSIGLFIRAEAYPRAIEVAKMLSTDFQKAGFFKGFDSHLDRVWANDRSCTRNAPPLTIAVSALLYSYEKAAHLFR